MAEMTATYLACPIRQVISNFDDVVTKKVILD